MDNILSSLGISEQVKVLQKNAPRTIKTSLGETRVIYEVNAGTSAGTKVVQVSESDFHLLKKGATVSMSFRLGAGPNQVFANVQQEYVEPETDKKA